MHLLVPITSTFCDLDNCKEKRKLRASKGSVGFLRGHGTNGYRSGMKMYAYVYVYVYIRFLFFRIYISEVDIVYI